MQLGGLKLKNALKCKFSIICNQTGRKKPKELKLKAESNQEMENWVLAFIRAGVFYDTVSIDCKFV